MIGSAGPGGTRMIFRQLFDPTSSTYTYLIGDRATRQAVIVDSVLEHWQRDAALVRELGLTPVTILETHVHADHVTGAWWLRREFGCPIALAAASGAADVDRPLADTDRIPFGHRHLSVRATPGHTPGCLTYVLDDESAAFTGDCLLIRGTGRTDFQRGDAAAMFRSIRDRILTLPQDCLLYPAHDYRGLTVSSVAEERRFNPRVADGVAERDFLGYLRNLNLPHPKLLERAVPANLRLGAPDSGVDAGDRPDWAPLRFTVAGVWEIDPATLAECADGVLILDVRSAEEFQGPAGHIPGARWIPLDQLTARAGELPRDRPIVTVCHSGSRSAQAAVLLQKADFPRIANLAGGMLRWTAEHHRITHP